MKHRFDDFVFFHHHFHGFVLQCQSALIVFAVAASAFRSSGRGQGNPPPNRRAFFEDAIDPGNGLHQAMSAHRLVDVERVQAGHIKARQPHIAHDDKLQRVFRIFSPFCEAIGSRFAADVALPGLGSVAEPVITILIAPALSSSLSHSGRNFGISFRAPRRCGGSCTRSWPCRPSRTHAFEVADKILSDERQPLLRAHECLNGGPFLLEALLLVGASSSVNSAISASILGFSFSSSAIWRVGSRSRSGPLHHLQPRG